jgi:hypothetical protein
MQNLCDSKMLLTKRTLLVQLQTMKKAKEVKKAKLKGKRPTGGVTKVHPAVYDADFQKISPISQAIKKSKTSPSSSFSSLPFSPATSKDKTPTSSSLDDYKGFPWESTAAFKAVVDSLTVYTKDKSRGLVRQCPHCQECYKPRKNMKHTGDFGNECLECTCTKNKGVCEQLLVDQGILE